MLEADSRQVGGSHYRSDYQHWNWVLKVRLGYLLGCSTKYVARWRDKEGLKDLRKAGHYLQKQREVGGYASAAIDFDEAVAETNRFIRENSLSFHEAVFMRLSIAVDTPQDFELMEWALQELITEGEQREAANIPTPPPVPLTEENHHSPRANRDEEA